MEGGLAGSAVGSEMAAMFEWAILPAMRECYHKENLAGECKAFAAQIGLEPHMWPLVHVPAFISVDSAKIHPHMRKLITAPRWPLETLENMRKECLSSKLGIRDLPERIEPAMRPPPPVVMSLQDWQPQRQRLADEQRAEQQKQARLLAAVQAYVEEHEVDPWQEELWKLAGWKKGHMCVLLEQWMPLSAVSPDLHSPVEHMVGTLKREVHEKILDADQNDPRLKTGKVYQQFILEAVAKRGNSEKGRKHIAGSVRKLPFICRILAAQQGEVLKLTYSFGGADAKEYEVRGTAGGWIRESKWT